MGVFIEYRDFICWIEEREEYKKVPNPILPTLKWLVYAAVVIGLYLTIGEPYYSI